MSAVLRGFVTPWASWVSRWSDSRMQPSKSPLWLCDCAKDGVFVGPYVDPQGRMRTEVVFYASVAKAQHELYLRPTDFAPVAPWLDATLAQASKDTRELFGGRITAALGHLRATPHDGRAYIRDIVAIGIDLVKAIGDARGGGPAELPPEFQAKLDERDAFVEREAQERMRLVGKARGSN